MHNIPTNNSKTEILKLCIISENKKNLPEENVKTLRFFKDESPCFKAPSSKKFTRFISKNNNNPASKKLLPINYDIKKDIMIAHGQSSLFLNESPKNLFLSKSYNYVITQDGELSFGMVNDNWEVGVKHLHLSQMRYVLCAGEFKLDEIGEYTFNIFSGSLLQELLSKNPKYKDILTEIVTQIFLYKMSKPGTFINYGLHDNNHSSIENQNFYCSFDYFKKNNYELCGK